MSGFFFIWDQGVFCRSKWSLQDLGLVDGSHASAQEVLHLTTDRLKITSEDNFWSTMLEAQSSGQVQPGF